VAGVWVRGLWEGLGDAGGIAGADGKDDAAGVEGPRVALDGEEFLEGGELRDEVVVELGDGRVLDEGFVLEPVAPGDGFAVALEEIARRGEVVLSIPLVDGDGRLRSGGKIVSRETTTSRTMRATTYCSWAAFLSFLFFLI
jgi:hypothetical protein